MTVEPLAAGAPAIILFREVDRDDMGRGSHGGVTVMNNEALTGRYEDNYFRVKILTEEGRKYANVEIPFAKVFEDIKAIHARTIHPDGSIANFDGKAAEKTLLKNKGGQYDAVTFTLPDVQVGSIIEYFYTIEFKGGWIHGSNWIISQDLFTKHAKFTLRPFQGDTTLTLRWSEHLPSGMPSTKQDPGGLVHLDVDNVFAFQREDFMPPENDLKARVDFTYAPTYDLTELDPNKYWKKIGRKRAGEAEDFGGKREAVQRVVAETISPGDSDEMKLQKLYARVQQLKNSSFETPRTDDEKKRDKEKAAPNAEDVLRQSSGTRTQLNWLYLALVRAAGFEAYGVWVSDRSNYIFNPQSMNSGRLDRSLVLVRLAGKDLYFEPGAEFTPFGILDWAETGVPGLRLDKDGGTWVQTAVPDSSLSQIQHKAELKLSDTGDLEGKLTVTFTGLEALRRRVGQRNADEVARKRYLEEEVQQTIPVASEVKLTNSPDWASSSSSLQAEFSLKVPGWVQRGGRVALCPVGLFGANERHVFDHAERVHPIYFEFPSQRVDDINIELPTGWNVGALPKAQNQDYHVVGYSVGAESSKTGFHVKRRLDVNIISLDTKYYSPIRSFFQGVRVGDAEQVVLQPGAAVSSN